MKLKKRMLCAVGIVLTALGAIGAFVPLLPAFPFLLGALVCFGKGSERLHTWFLRSSLYRNHVESYRMRRAMTIKTKCTVIASVTLSIGFGIWMLRGILGLQLLLGAIWLFHILYFLFRVKTYQPDADASGESGENP